MATHVVIMAGGIGSRFWPLSTPGRPKQFIDILGCGRTLIQLTADRFAGIAPQENFWVVTGEAYVQTVREQLPDVPAAHILAEPAARNTAPCIAWASWKILSEDPAANVVVTPADAVVMDPVEFRRVISNALTFTASRDAIVTVGIKPTRPETGYGYVETSAIPGGVEESVIPVRAFKEKPDLATAERYNAAGSYLWNAGIFVWNVRTVVGCLRRYKPGIAAVMDLMADGGSVAELFPGCEKISIDFAVMEPAAADGIVFTHPADFGWSDLGNWASLYDKLGRDAAGNAAVGPVRLYECSDCIVHAEDATHVALQGLDGYIVSLKDGRLLVCRRSEEQRIREFSGE